MVGVLEQVSGAIEILEHVVAELEPVTFDGEHAPWSSPMCFTHGERLSAAGKTFMARRVDDTFAWRRDGHRSSAHWLAATTGVSVGAATATIATARAFDVLPSTAEAFRAGELSAQQASEITAAAAETPDSEQELLEHTRKESFKGLRDRCREVPRREPTMPNSLASCTRHAGSTAGPTRTMARYRADLRLHPEAGAAIRRHAPHQDRRVVQGSAPRQPARAVRGLRRRRVGRAGVRRSIAAGRREAHRQPRGDHAWAHRARRDVHHRRNRHGPGVGGALTARRTR